MQLTAKAHPSCLCTFTWHAMKWNQVAIYISGIYGLSGRAINS